MFVPLRLLPGPLQGSNRTTATVWRLLYGSVLSGNSSGPRPLPLLASGRKSSWPHRSLEAA